jgi:hypothetical protein
VYMQLYLGQRGELISWGYCHRPKVRKSRPTHPF